MAKAKVAKPVPAVVLLIGDEPLLQREAWEDLVARVFGGDVPPMAIAEFDGPTCRVGDVLDEVRTPSFLAPRKLVRVREADALLRGGGSAGEAADEDDDEQEPAAEPGGAKKGGYRDLFVRYAEQPCESGVLVLQLKAEARTTRLYKTVDKLGGIVSCAPPDRNFDPVAWCRERCSTEHDKTLADDAALALADAVGADLSLLANELDKLALYVGDKGEITAADVEQLVGQNRTESVFQIADSIAEGNAAAALTHWRRLIDNERDAPFKAVGGFAFSFRKLLAARRLMDQGVAEFDIIKQTGAWGLKNRMGRILGPLSAARLEEALALLLEIDQASKSGLGDVEALVEKFIVHMTRRVAGAA